MEYERLKPRSFTGLTDEEWTRFGTVVKSFLGSGKRSMFISTMIKHVNDNAQCFYEKLANIEERAQHAINDSLRFFGIKLLDQKKDLDK